MTNRQYCASCYVIDFDKEEVLLMYNEKLEKWLQPGCHIEGYESPIDAAIREVYEETGINITIIGPSYKENYYQPIATERYINNVGDMIDIQYLAIPINKNIHSNEKKLVKWVKISNLTQIDDLADDINIKVRKLYDIYRR